MTFDETRYQHVTAGRISGVEIERDWKDDHILCVAVSFNLDLPASPMTRFTPLQDHLEWLRRVNQSRRVVRLWYCGHEGWAAAKYANESTNAKDYLVTVINDQLDQDKEEDKDFEGDTGYRWGGMYTMQEWVDDNPEEEVEGGAQ